MIFIHSFFIFLGPRGFLDKRGQKGFDKPDQIYQEPKLQKLFEEISSLTDLSELITELAYKEPEGKWLQISVFFVLLAIVTHKICVYEYLPVWKCMVQ